MKMFWKPLLIGSLGIIAILAVTAGVSSNVTPVKSLKSDFFLDIPGALVKQNIEKAVAEHRVAQERRLFDSSPYANHEEDLSSTLPIVEGFHNQMHGLPENLKPMWNAALLLVGTSDEGVGIGSAFVVRIKRKGNRIFGYLMTNNHVIADYCNFNGICPDLFTLNDIGLDTRSGEVFRSGPNVMRVQGARVLKTTNPPDLALLEVELEESAMNFLKVAAVNVNNVTNGTAVYAIGFPNTSRRTSANAKPIEEKSLVIKRWSEGVVEQTITHAEVGELVVHTADILPGNSGSGLFNREGTVVGVNVLLFNARRDMDYNGGGCNVPPTARASVAPRMLAPYMNLVNSL